MQPSKKEGGSDPDIKLTDTDKHIVGARLKNSAITISDIAGIVGMSRSGVQCAIDKLKKMNVLIREGSTKRSTLFSGH